jgi:hypothetical protein
MERYDDPRRDAEMQSDTAYNRPPDTLPSDEPIERIDGVEARQGGLGRPVLYVLVAALILGAFYLMGTTFWASNETNIPGGQISTTQSQPNPAPSGTATGTGSTAPPAAAGGNGASAPDQTNNPVTRTAPMQ